MNSRMRDVNANPWQTLMTIVVAISLALCSCQAGAIFHGLSSSGAGVTQAAAPICCSGCQGASEEAPTDQSRSTPSRGRAACCVKGTGQHDVRPDLPDGNLVTGMKAAPALPFRLFASQDEVCTRFVSGVPRVDLQTLLRLHCAQIV